MCNDPSQLRAATFAACRCPQAGEDQHARLIAIQEYLAAAGDSARLAVQPPEPRPRAGERSKAFALYSLPKLRIPGKCRLPKMLPEALTPGATRRGHEMHISGPVGRDDARFHDRPVGGRAMGPTGAAAKPKAAAGCVPSGRIHRGAVAKWRQCALGLRVAIGVGAERAGNELQSMCCSSQFYFGCEAQCSRAELPTST